MNKMKNLFGDLLRVVIKHRCKSDLEKINKKISKLQSDLAKIDVDLKDLM